MISQGQGCFVVVRERWEAGRAAGRRRVRSMLDADLAVGDGGEGYPQGNQLPLRPAALRPVAELLLGAVDDLFLGLLLHRDHLLVNLQVEDRKSTRLNPVTNAHLVCRLLLEKKKEKTQSKTRTR